MCIRDSSYSYLHTVVERARERFSPEDCAKLEEMLTIVSTELMPELDMLKTVSYTHLSPFCGIHGPHHAAAGGKSC